MRAAITIKQLSTIDMTEARVMPMTTRRHAIAYSAPDPKEMTPEEQARSDRAVFARAALIRKLPSVKVHSKSANSPLRRPSTASAVVRSRVHQTLQRNNSEFSLANSHNGATHIPSGIHSSLLQNPPRTAEKLPLPFTERSNITSHLAIHPPIADDSDRHQVSAPSSPAEHAGRSKSVALRRPSQRKSTVGSSKSPHRGGNAEDGKATVVSISIADEQASILRKRRCAETFADMLSLRINVDGAKDRSDTDASGVRTLLDHGIIQSILNLTSTPDPTTLLHCSRALYFLSAFPPTRKTMIAQGVVAGIKPLARIAPLESREDLAATLCRLAEEPDTIEALFFEGIDRSLLRLFTTSGPETRRICAIAAFNLSVDASQLKHFGESFSQLLVNFSKPKSVPTISDAGEQLPSVSYLMKAIYNVSLIPAYHSTLLGDSIPRFMMLQMPTLPANTQAWALRSFVLLSGTRLNRVQVLSQQFCKLIRSALTSSEELTQELAVIELILLSLDEGSRIKLCNWVPASVIVQSSQKHLEAHLKSNFVEMVPESDGGRGSPSHRLAHIERKRRLLHFHAYLLRNLCESVLTHHELIQEGVIPALLGMSRVDDITLKSSSISALCSIISSSTDDIVRNIPGITEQLLTLTLDCEPVRCEFAVTALYNISCCDDTLELLGCSESLLATVLRLARSLKQSRLADLVSAIVYRLATVPECAPKLLEHGYLPALIQLIHQFPSCRTFALNALYLLVQFGGSVFPHGGEEIAQLVVALLSDGQESSMGLTQKGETITDPVMLRSAVTLLAHLANHAKNRGMLVRNGLIFRFLKRMHRVSDNECIVPNNCTFVLYCLTATQEGSELLAKERGIEDIIFLARTRSQLESQAMPALANGPAPGGDVYAVQELCMQALCRLSSYMGLESRLIEQGAIQGAMVLALVKTDRIGIKAMCVRILANCLTAKQCTRSLIDNGVVWALSSLCIVPYPSTDADTYAACAISLCNLSSVSSMVPKFLDAGAPRALTHLLQQHIASQSVLVIIKAIANLVANEKICQAFLNEDIEKHLSAHFDSPSSSDEIRQLAAMVLLRTTSISSDMISVEHLRTRVFRWMEQIVVMKEEELVRNCILTVHDLTCNPSIDAKELDAPLVLRILVQVLHRHRSNVEIVTLCLSVVYNLSCELALLHYLVQEDIMLLLRQQVPTPAGLSRSRRSSQSELDARKVNSAEAAVAYQSSDAIKLCCFILHNVSCSAGAPNVSHRDSVLVALIGFRAPILLHDVYFISTDCLKETCAISLCNITVGKVNSTKLVEDNAHKVLIDFIYTHHFKPEHMPLFSAAFRKLSIAPGNQPQLLSAGIAKAMVEMLSCSQTDWTATENLLATLSLLSRGAMHLQQLADDGVLPCVVSIAERGGISAELQANCFEIITNLCKARFDDEDSPAAQREMNIVSTLMKLSEHHSSRISVTSTPTINAPSECFYSRGPGQPLPLPELLTHLMKSPSSTTSLKKNLELKATYTVPARKWVCSAQPRPKDPPALECRELPLADPAQALPLDVKQQIARMRSLPHEPLVRRSSRQSKEQQAPPQRQQDEPPWSELTSSANASTSTVSAKPRLSRSLGAKAAPAVGARRLKRAASGRHILERGYSSGSGAQQDEDDEDDMLDGCIRLAS